MLHCCHPQYCTLHAPPSFNTTIIPLFSRNVQWSASTGAFLYTNCGNQNNKQNTSTHHWTGRHVLGLSAGRRNKVRRSFYREQLLRFLSRFGRKYQRSGKKGPCHCPSVTTQLYVTEPAVAGSVKDGSSESSLASLPCCSLELVKRAPEGFFFV